MKHFITAITTYNRLKYLKKCIKTWNNTRSKHRTTTLIIADDGSTDGTLEYLKNLVISDVDIHILTHDRRGVHHQVNKIFELCSTLNFHFGFKIDDDLIFLRPNWDNAYYEVAMSSGYHHLNFFDENWWKRKHTNKLRSFNKGQLSSKIENTELQGAFWTFTKEVIKKVGYFDLTNFGLCGLGHIDFSWRCSRAGFNDINHIFDLTKSFTYLKLISENYIHSVPDIVKKKDSNFPQDINRKLQKMREQRVYIPYNEVEKRLS